MKKIIILILIAITLSFSLLSCGNKSVPVNKGVKEMVKPKIEISVKEYGKMQFELDPENAPLTVENFVKLAKSEFYNGLTFHRIIAGFMIQGGDPLGDGTGGSPDKIKGEFIENGVDNKIEHRRGVISMARSQSFDSASSQFFICHEDSTFLDGQYAAFGKILSGIEIVDKICQDTRVLDGNGKVSKLEQPVIEYVKVLE